MKCSKCGYENPEGAVFCANCGAKIVAASQVPGSQDATHASRISGSENDSTAQHQDNFNTYYHEQQNKPGNSAQAPLPDFNPNIPPEYQPITMWGYFAYEILFSIPCIGLIALIFFSFGGAKNVNLRNFARSYFCFLIIACIVFALLGGCSMVFSVFD